MTDLDRQIGELIGARRRHMDPTVRDLAHAVGVTPTELARWEDGTTRCPAAKLAEIAQVLKVTLAWFFTECAA